MAGVQGQVDSLTQVAVPLETDTPTIPVAATAPPLETDTPTLPVTATATPDTSVPDGTYVGVTTIPEYWDNYSQGGWGERTIEENEITIIVSPYGDVSGGVIFVGKGTPVSVPGETCIYTVNVYSTATLSGSLTETGGTIDIVDELTTEIIRNGCPGDSETNTFSNNYQTQVSIIDNQIITGDVPGYFLGSFNFNATKQ